jgi:3-dehydroquinate synthase
MQTVKVDLGERSYDIAIGSGMLKDLGGRIKEFGFTKCAIISNPTVFYIYGDVVSESLKNSDVHFSNILIPDGEEYKDYFWSYHILSGLLKERLDRNSCLIALGGGVIGDITGFAASAYMRGIHFIQVPTTLLAHVDSSVGGKTGVNHPLGKNMIGSFYQPRLVWIDTDTLKTLPEREFLCGMAEVIKYGVIWDEEFFEFLQKSRDAILRLDAEAIVRVIKRSCEIKADVVSKDERESGLRAILNYGHTIGHAIETETGYTRYLHGEAVAIGMHLEAALSKIMGIANEETVERIKNILEKFGLPSRLPLGLDADKLISHMQLDKKTVAGTMKFIVPEKIGRVRIDNTVSPKQIIKALKE